MGSVASGSSGRIVVHAGAGAIDDRPACKASARPVISSRSASFASHAAGIPPRRRTRRRSGRTPPPSCRRRRRGSPRAGRRRWKVASVCEAHSAASRHLHDIAAAADLASAAVAVGAARDRLHLRRGEPSTVVAADSIVVLVLRRAGRWRSMPANSRQASTHSGAPCVVRELSPAWRRAAASSPREEHGTGASRMSGAVAGRVRVGRRRRTARRSSRSVRSAAPTCCRCRSSGRCCSGSRRRTSGSSGRSWSTGSKPPALDEALGEAQRHRRVVGPLARLQAERPAADHVGHRREASRGGWNSRWCRGRRRRRGRAGSRGSGRDRASARRLLRLGNRRDRHLEAGDPHRQLRALTRRRVGREPAQPLFVQAGEVVLVGEDDGRRSRSSPASCRPPRGSPGCSRRHCRCLFLDGGRRPAHPWPGRPERCRRRTRDRRPSRPGCRSAAGLAAFGVNTMLRGMRAPGISGASRDRLVPDARSHFSALSSSRKISIVICGCALTV